ncbi:hypothetical protein ACFSCX_11375 [Bacillus salitolerans]|uniref:YodN n=1 Tax=Bacillus salitolerans TaxID=1437434 RepID=A0ABW4LQN3_9BACI
MKNKKPKFKVGDIVVITLYGTVSKITNVKMVNGMYVYELNNKDGIFLENTLENINHYKGQETKKEAVSIEFNYYFGDIVQIKDYGDDLFKVVGLRSEIWRYKQDAWEDIVYELSRLSDGEWLEASEDEMILIADHEQAPMFLQKIELIYIKKKENLMMEMLQSMNFHRKTEKELLRLRRERRAIIDGLLDVYNDYQFLYKTFGDEEYKNVMDLVLQNLMKFTDGKGEEIN